MAKFIGSTLSVVISYILRILSSDIIACDTTQKTPPLDGSPKAYHLEKIFSLTGVEFKIYPYVSDIDCWKKYIYKVCSRLHTMLEVAISVKLIKSDPTKIPEYEMEKMCSMVFDSCKRIFPITIFKEMHMITNSTSSGYCPIYESYCSYTLALCDDMEVCYHRNTPMEHIRNMLEEQATTKRKKRRGVPKVAPGGFFVMGEMELSSTVFRNLYHHILEEKINYSDSEGEIIDKYLADCFPMLSTLKWNVSNMLTNAVTALEINFIITNFINQEGTKMSLYEVLDPRLLFYKLVDDGCYILDLRESCEIYASLIHELELFLHLKAFKESMF